MKNKKLLAYNLFELNTGYWYLGWWLETSARLPEFHSQVYTSKTDAEAKLVKLHAKYSAGTYKPLQVVDSARLSELSWQTNPDRMGGQFTEQEIADSGKWI